MPSSATSDRAPATIGTQQFQWIQEVVQAAAGIQLTRNHTLMVSTRLGRRIRATGVPDLPAYIALVQQDATCAELWAMIDALTVNQTGFFRGADHFAAYAACLRELLRTHDSVTVWSAGCASGEETFTLAILAHALAPDAPQRVRVLGTDISATALRTARTATYDVRAVQHLPAPLRSYLEPVRGTPQRLRVIAPVRRMVSFARHNLVGAWHMRGPMHIIFCRNVLIYFDGATQSHVTEGLQHLLAPGGYLFLGHTETVSATSTLRYLQPAIYRKATEAP